MGKTEIYSPGTAAVAAAELAGATAAEVISWAAEMFAPGLVAASSMADGVLSHLVAAAAPGTPVLFLDTGYHFPETLGLRDAVSSSYGVEVRTLLPLLSVEEQDRAHGPELWRRDPTACCAMRKVDPLERALEEASAWMTGLRRAEASTRTGAQVVEWDLKRSIVKINPIVGWSDADVAAYTIAHDVFLSPLAERGYTSIGCAPCTRVPLPGEDPRAGRWAGSAKTECGLHN